MSRINVAARSLPRSWRLLYLTLTVLMVAGVLASTTAPVLAIHPWGRHVDSVHVGSGQADDIGPGDQETACVQIRSGSMTHTYAWNRILNTLVEDNPSGDWENATGDNEIDFWFYYDPCFNLTSAERADSEIEFHVWSDADARNRCIDFMGVDAPNCTIPDYNYPLSSPAGTHTDYKYFYTYFQRRWLDDSVSVSNRRHIVSHEAGHILGLNDPNGYCPSYNSVMHPDYYCSGEPRLQYPTFGSNSDANSVHTIIHNR